MRREYSMESLKKYKYPNLVAEIMETGYSICTVSEFMGHGRREESDEFIRAKIFGNREILAGEAVGLVKLFGCDFKYLFAEELSICSEKPLAYWRHYESNKSKEWDMDVFRLAEQVKNVVKEKPYLYEIIQSVLNMVEEQLKKAA